MKCSAPEVPINGVPFEKEAYMYNEVIEYKCQNGFIVIGDKTSVCGISGTFASTVTSCSLGNYNLFSFYN